MDMVRGKEHFLDLNPGDILIPTWMSGRERTFLCIAIDFDRCKVNWFVTTADGESYFHLQGFDNNSTICEDLRKINAA